MRRVAAVLTVLLAVAGCSSDGAGTATPTTSGSPSDTATPAPSTRVSSGTVKTEVKGEQRFSLEIALSAADSQYNAPPAGFAFVFKDEDNNLVTLGGAAFEGEKKSSGTLAIGVVFNRDGLVIAHTDTDGGCDLTMKRSGSTVAGSFDCPTVEDGRYQVTGEFTVELA